MFRFQFRVWRQRLGLKIEFGFQICLRASELRFKTWLMSQDRFLAVLKVSLKKWQSCSAICRTNVTYATPLSFQVEDLDFSSLLHCAVEVDDYNDHAPVFIPHFLSLGPLSEDVPVGTSVARLLASDSDSGQNRQLVYSLSRDSDPDGLFVKHTQAHTHRWRTLSLVIYKAEKPQKVVDGFPAFVLRNWKKGEKWVKEEKDYLSGMARKWMSEGAGRWRCTTDQRKWWCIGDCFKKPYNVKVNTSSAHFPLQLINY